MITEQLRKDAAAARLLVAITFHFLDGRLCYFEKVLSSIAGFPLTKRDVVVFTNTTSPAEQQSIRDAFRKAGLVDGRDARLVAVQSLSHPYHLTWAHKKLISGSFLGPDSPYTHFAYIEDDEELTFDNFAYFVAAREILRPYNLLPALLRTEWSAQRKCWVNADHPAPIVLAQRRFLAAGDHFFFPADNPYWGGFILDQELAREYAGSPSFDMARSESLTYFGVRERAAMGLTYEDASPLFRFRVAVPMSAANRTAPPCSWLMHLPNRFADNPDTAFGKVSMTDLFAGDFKARKEVKLRYYKVENFVARLRARLRSRRNAPPTPVPSRKESIDIKQAVS